MSSSDFEVIFSALEKAHMRYLVVGGVAVVLHGVPRFTADLDLVLSLEATNVLAALSALKGLGYRPRAPVVAEQFAAPEIRGQWIREKRPHGFFFVERPISRNGNPSVRGRTVSF